MIAFIDRHRDHFGVEAICRVLGAPERGFLTSRGYRAAKQRPASARAVRDEVLVEEIRRIHAENYGVYGYRKMHHAMRRAGWEVGRDQTARLMKAAGLCGIRRGRKVFTTSPAGGLDRRPDLVERNFTAAGPNQLWVADITYVRIPSGFCYTAFITDVFTRRIVGWAVATSLRTEALPLQALEQALQTSPTEASRTGLIHHSDRGSNYVSLAYSDALITTGVQASVGSVGDSYDNALAETVNGLYKAELIHRRRIWPSATAVEIAYRYTLPADEQAKVEQTQVTVGDFRGTPAEISTHYAMPGFAARHPEAFTRLPDDNAALRQQLAQLRAQVDAVDTTTKKMYVSDMVEQGYSADQIDADLRGERPGAPVGGRKALRSFKKS